MSTWFWVHSRKGLRLYDPVTFRASSVTYGQDTGVNCGYLEAFALWALGYPDQSVRTMDDTLSHARELAHPFSVAQTLNFSAHLRQLLRDPQLARMHADEALAICAEHGFKAYGSWALLPRGWALAQQGLFSEGVDNIGEAVAAWQAMKVGGVMPWFYAALGETYGLQDRFAEGLHALDEALEWVHRTNEHMYEAETYRLKGELLLGRTPSEPERAQEAFRRALDVATAQEAMSWQLRAATSLARLLCGQGERSHARELLEPTYNWFTEGLATPDLRDAKALLDAIEA